MKEQIKAPEKIQLSDKEIANLLDAQFKTLVIKMLTEIVEYGPKNRGKSESYENERKIYREPPVKGKKWVLKSMVWTRRRK